LRPGEFLVPDQFFDRTSKRISTFFGNGIVAHVAFDKPTCPQVAGLLSDASETSKVKVHRRGTYVCIEGPQFSTIAEAHVHRQLRFEVIGMTNVTEAKLAREAEICYATIAMITDYDCWHPEHDAVTGAQILATLQQNALNAQRVLREAVRTMPAERKCTCGSALGGAIFTDPKVIPADTKKKLSAIVGKYLK
jgi:5'-methylthioadenosine phosphorylase